MSSPYQNNAGTPGANGNNPRKRPSHAVHPDDDLDKAPIAIAKRFAAAAPSSNARPVPVPVPVPGPVLGPGTTGSRSLPWAPPPAPSAAASRNGFGLATPMPEPSSTPTVQQQQPTSVQEAIRATTMIDLNDDDQFLIESVRLYTDIVGIDDHFGIARRGDKLRLTCDLTVSSVSSASTTPASPTAADLDAAGDDSDSASIRVDNALGVSVGVLRRGFAKVIAPLVLANRIQLSATVEADANDSSIPICVTVLTPSENDAIVRAVLQHFKLYRQVVVSSNSASSRMPAGSTPSAASRARAEAAAAAAAAVQMPPAAYYAQYPPPPAAAAAAGTHVNNAYLARQQQMAIMQAQHQQQFAQQHLLMMAQVKSEATANAIKNGLAAAAAAARSGSPSLQQQPPLAQPTPAALLGFISSSGGSATPTPSQPGATLQPQMTRPIVADEEWQRLLQLGQDLNDQSRSAILDSVGLKEQDLANLREAPQPDGLLTPLLPYQRQGLGWMIQAEHPREPTEDKESQFWLVRTVQTEAVAAEGGAGEQAAPAAPAAQPVEHTMYLNTATNSVAQGKPRLARAGLIADDMGLGKTIQVLALILSHPAGTPFLTPGESCGVSDHFCNTTLIVCPLSVVSNWELQLRQHVETSRLKHYVFHGPQRRRDHKYLQSFDLIITTYETLATVPDDKCPLHKVRWRRVVLDEGHSIRTRGTKKSMAACSLFAERKWVLSGTPLQNKLEDLYPLLKFMELFPFDNLDIWKATFDAPIRKGNARALEKFKQLMQTICLRRTKRMKLNGKPLLELPPFRSVVHKIGFNPVERDLYAKWEAKTRVTLEQVLRNAEERQYARQMGYRYATSGADNAQAQGCLLKYLTRLRQLCNHRALAEKEKAPKGGGVARMLALLRENAGEDCPMCLNAMRNPSITMCGHWFCFACLDPAVKAARECPQCQSQMTPEQIYKLPAEGEEYEDDDTASQAASGAGGADGEDDEQDRADEDGNDGQSPGDGGDGVHASKVDTMLGMRFSTADYLSSTKIDALMTFLETSRSRDPTVKSVVFSQWTGMLNLIEIPLRRRGFEFTRLDGSMHRKVREANINRFQTEPSVLVFLISTTAGAVGLNLVAASNCFMVDPMWNPMVERQAIDRIYRIGQKRPVTVVKLAMEDSVEERVLALQERKRRMAEEAFGENPQYQESTSKSARLEDIRAILGSKRKNDAKLAEEVQESDEEEEEDN